MRLNCWLFHCSWNDSWPELEAGYLTSWPVCFGHGTLQFLGLQVLPWEDVRATWTMELDPAAASRVSGVWRIISVWFFHTLLCHCERKTTWFFTSCCSVESVLQSKSSSWCLLENLSASDNVTFHVCSEQICVSHLSASLQGFHRIMEYPDPWGSAKSSPWPLLLMTSSEIFFCEHPVGKQKRDCFCFSFFQIYHSVPAHLQDRFKSKEIHGCVHLQVALGTPGW